MRLLSELPWYSAAMSPVPEHLTVEVVFAAKESQVLREVRLAPGATVADAIVAADVATEFPDEDVAALTCGIWGRVVDRDRVLTDGDRVELYRPLQLDPREARRLLALSGQTMRGATGD